MQKTVLSLLAFSLLATPVYAEPVPKAATAPIQSQSRSVIERNKANVLAFYELGINRFQPQKAADLYLGDVYLQHNPHVADGAKAFVQAFTELAQSKPQARGTIKRVIAEGDLVVLHVHRQDTPDDVGRAVIDIFRLDDNGKIVEHWDVSQPIPDKTVSGRSMF